MAGPALILRELHRLRRHLKDLETKLDQGPRTLKAHQNRVAQQEAAVKQGQDALKQLKLKIHDKEVSVKATQQQIKKYEKQLDDVKSKKEYDTLRAEIANAEAHIRQLEDEALDLMGQAEDQAARIKDTELAVQKARADVAQVEKDQAEKLARFSAERARAEEELKAVEVTLPADVKPIYTRLVTAKGPDAIAGVKGNICSACYTEITAQMRADLNHEAFFQCRSCGRMLYPED